MTKVHLFANIAGKSAKYSNDYFCDNYSEKNKQLTDGIIEIVAEHNEKNTHKISCKLNEELNLLEVSNGQTFRMRKPSKLGTISVHSDHIKACGVRIDKTDIDPTSICEDSFKTIHGSTIKFW
jgi:hypothetical protein